MRVNIRNNQGGFTITELLIAVALGAMATMLITVAYVNTYGSAIAAQVRAQMTQEGQLFLRRMTEDIRVANSVRVTNVLTDPSNATGWVTSDPANILIITQPATDASSSLIIDANTALPYQHEIVYFGQNDVMFRRVIANPDATDTVQLTTCPAGTIDCPRDTELVNNLDNMQFTFYDVDNQVVTDAALARSIEVSINLSKKVYGQTVVAQNTTRVTLRNE